MRPLRQSPYQIPSTLLPSPLRVFSCQVCDEAGTLPTYRYGGGECPHQSHPGLATPLLASGWPDSPLFSCRPLTPPPPEGLLTGCQSGPSCLLSTLPEATAWRCSRLLGGRGQCPTPARVPSQQGPWRRTVEEGVQEAQQQDKRAKAGTKGRGDSRVPLPPPGSRAW